MTEPHFLQTIEAFTWPAYDGRSIGNIPATIAETLKVPFNGLPALEPKLWQPLAGDCRRVVLLTLDAFGWNLLQAEEARLGGLLNKADIVEQITSIFPSTTVAALSSLWTGAAPAQHGMLALNMFFPEYATETQMLFFTPTFGRYPDALIAAGLKPESFLQWPGMAEQLAQQGVPTHAFKGREIIYSALSRMHGRGVSGDHGAITFSDMLDQVAQMLEATADESLYLSAYWPTIDTISHFRHWDGEATRAEIRTLFYQIQTQFLDKLSASAREGTLFFITADHGQIALPTHIYLEDHPKLQQMLFMKPSGEPRITYLYAKHGRIEEIVQYINQHLGAFMVALTAEEALASGLFGPQPHTAVAHERIGDVVVIMRQDAVLFNQTLPEQARHMVGGHGGMSHGEMQVPWIGFRLDGW